MPTAFKPFAFADCARPYIVVPVLSVPARTLSSLVVSLYVLWNLFHFIYTIKSYKKIRKPRDFISIRNRIVVILPLIKLSLTDSFRDRLNI